MFFIQLVLVARELRGPKSLGFIFWQCNDKVMTTSGFGDSMWFCMTSRIFRDRP
jgi:hypothetical protein